MELSCERTAGEHKMKEYSCVDSLAIDTRTYQKQHHATQPGRQTATSTSLATSHCDTPHFTCINTMVKVTLCCTKSNTMQHKIQ